MTDGVTFQSATPATPPAGTVAASDDAGAAGQVQIVKLAIAANGSATVLPGDATDGLLVNLGANNDVRVTDGTDTLAVNSDGSINIVGSIGLPVIQSQAQNSSGLTTASTSYTSGDVLGAGWTFTSMSSGAGKGGRILGASLLDKAGVVAAVDLVLSSGSISVGSDNAGLTTSDSDGEKVMQTISMVALSYTNNRVATAGNILVPYICDSTSLYVYAVTRSNHTFFGATSDLRLRLLYTVDA